MSAHVLVFNVEIRLNECGSRKDKLAVVNPILEGASERYRVAPAETGFFDIDDRAGLSFACVSASTGHATGTIDKLEQFVWSFREIEVVASERVWAALS